MTSADEQPHYHAAQVTRAAAGEPGRKPAGESIAHRPPSWPVPGDTRALVASVHV